jgi:hypothetical protein
VTKPKANRIFSYQQFRQITELTKREADGWVQRGLIRAELSASGRRRLYTIESLFYGVIAKSLADFASRELLETMMHSLREFFDSEGIELHKVSPNSAGPRVLVRIHTQTSKELMPGGGIRGVVTYVSFFDPLSKWVSKAVFVVIDLTLVAVIVNTRIGDLNKDS